MAKAWISNNHKARRIDRIYHTRECRHVKAMDETEQREIEALEAWGFVECQECKGEVEHGTPDQSLYYKLVEQ